MADNRIFASGKSDPGCRDIFNSHYKSLCEHGNETLENKKTIPNNGIIVSPDPVNYPAPECLVELNGYWELEDQKRTFCLIVLDMEYGYEPYIKHCIPNVKKLLDTFRQLKQPVVWTNWGRRYDDKCYGANDRFFGPQGIADKTNANYIFGEQGIDTVAELAPQNEEEMSRTIISLHLSKFADLDENGREILFPMLEAWGVNTLVICGAWTDQCLPPTIFEAVDRYGYDTIVCPDGCATASTNGEGMMKVYSGATSKLYTTNELVEYLVNNPDKIIPPKARLHGDVRHTQMNYQRDPLLKEIQMLRRRVEELEKEKKYHGNEQ